MMRWGYCRKQAQRLTFGPGDHGDGLPHEGAGFEKLVPSFETNFVSSLRAPSKTSFPPFKIKGDKLCSGDVPEILQGGNGPLGGDRKPVQNRFVLIGRALFLQGYATRMLLR